MKAHDNATTKIIIRNIILPTRVGFMDSNQKLPPHSPETWWLLSEWKSPPDFHINTYPTLAHLHKNNWHSGLVGMIAIILQQWSLPIMDSRYIFYVRCTTKIHWNILEWYHHTETWSDKTWPQPALVEFTRALELSDEVEFTTFTFRGPASSTRCPLTTVSGLEKKH